MPIVVLPRWAGVMALGAQFGTDAAEQLSGGAGSDYIEAGAGNDTLSGGDGDDVLAGDAGDDLLLGGPGADLLLGLSGRDTLAGDDGDDTILAAAGWAQSVAGGAGADLIAGFGGGSTIAGGPGLDVFAPAAAVSGEALLLDFAAGDRLDFSALLSVQPGYAGDNPFGAAGILRLRQQGGDAVLDLDADGGGDGWQPLLRLAGVLATTLTAAELGFEPGGGPVPGRLVIGDGSGQPLKGSAGDDTLLGTDAAEALYGFGGADWIDGGNGADSLFGSTDADTLLGGNGNDQLDGGPGDDSIDGGLGDDTAMLHGSFADVTFTRSADGLIVSGPEGRDLYRATEWLQFTDRLVATASLALPRTVSVRALDAVRAEGTDGSTAFTFLLERGGDLSAGLSVRWSVTGEGASADDFAAGLLPTGETVFAPDASSAVVTILVQGDAVAEADEGFLLSLQQPMPDIAVLQRDARGVIGNDDTTLSITAVQPRRNEGQVGVTLFTFLVSRAGSLAGAASAQWRLEPEGEHAANADDFLAGLLPTGTVSFLPGESAATVTVTVLADTTLEADEGFAVVLSAPSPGLGLAQARASAVIGNDDTGFSVSALDGTRPEGDAGVTAFRFQLARSGDLTREQSLAWSVHGSGAAPANAEDFQGLVLPSGTFVFAVGEASRTITIDVRGDTQAEVTEQFTLVLSAPLDGGGTGTAEATATIAADDGTAVETAGGTWLTRVDGYYVLADASGTGPFLQWGGAMVTAGQFGGLLPIGAEAYGNGYLVAWKQNNADQFFVWQTDGDGRYVTTLLARVPGGSCDLQQIEIERVPPGSSDLPWAGATAPQPPGPAGIAGSIGAAIPVKVETSDTGMILTWQWTGPERYFAQDSTATVQYRGASRAGWSGQDFRLEQLESTLRHDLNGDGRIGPPPLVQDGTAGTALVQYTDSYLQEGDERVLQLIAQANAPTDADAQAGGYRVIWKLGARESFVQWRTDATGQYLWTPMASMASNDDLLSQMEVCLQQDLNGNGSIGPWMA